MPIDLRHANDGSCQDRVQIRGNRKQVVATRYETFEIIGIAEIEPQAEACQDHSEAKDVGQRIVMTELMLPADITRQIDGASDLVVAIPNGQVENLSLRPRQPSVVRRDSTTTSTAARFAASIWRSPAA